MDPVYKFLLCLKYLRTRYLAFVCIVSVMLGVATLIVVNSVMSGFSNKLMDRLHGVLSDVVIETDRSGGFEMSADEINAAIQASPVGKHVEATAPTVEVMALLQFYARDRRGNKIPIMKHVKLIGIDPEDHAKVGRFKEYLKRQRNVDKPNFDLTAEARDRMNYHRWLGDWDPTEQPRPNAFVPPNIIPPADTPKVVVVSPPLSASAFREVGIVVPPMPIIPAPEVPAGPPPRLSGVILGYSLAHYRYKDPETGITEEIKLLAEGDDVFLATVGSTGMKPVYSTFVVADYFHCEMSEYDSSFVYIPRSELQQLRAMGDRVNNIQIRLKPEAAADEKLVHEVIIPELQKLFQPGEAQVRSWQQHQGPLLEAIEIERSILNILLFLIVGVSGFSVLAIFSMIVAEKTRDIGVLKSLGASSRGIMTIFLSYGFTLGLIGSLLGTLLGYLLTTYINEIEEVLTMISGRQIFDRGIYYFDKIPTNIEGVMLAAVNIGAVGTSIVFSVLPAIRAARLNPVRALRFE